MFALSWGFISLSDAALLPVLALGNLWLSVHSMVDPASQSVTEIIPPSLASEMEEISFDHCHRLMTQSTKVCAAVV